MSTQLFSAIEQFARASNAPLGAQWNADLQASQLGDGAQAITQLQVDLSWRETVEIEGRPRADQFPLLMHDPAIGWAVALQWIGEDELSLAGGLSVVAWDEGQRFFIPDIPDPLAKGETKAINVFARAIKRRGKVLLIAGLATVFANILTLATSLYAMQLYDRVIPLASFETLFVLTAGVAFALLLDLSLRSLRAVLIEMEAQNIDREVSEFFFARAQAIRLDARPQGIGTLAAQIQGQEQIRQVMSSSSLFVLADLPFAIFFLLVIGAIGGSIALIPMISLPLAILLALFLARIIRNGAERAQVSGNQKNGMLVEMLDSSETVKANSGGWHLLGRWNRLIREIHNFEVPVKRASAVSGSLFSSLQQGTYVAVMGYGAYLAATGNITTGGLLACSIIVGRINGPLVAQLPQLIVQWGYARSSLRALDGVLQLPVERTSSSGGMRPGAMRGPIAAKTMNFAYQGGAPAVEIDALQIKPGERVALIGGIGAGKSTLLKLLAGLYTPASGTVTVNGLDLGQIAEDAARKHIGYLSQNARLVRGTLRENLTMGLGQIDDDALIEAAKSSGLEALIAGQNAGLDLPIHEGGIGLSGGQKALVGINRIIHARPPVWLLDEPTSALDTLSEAAAIAALEKAIRADDIVVMATHKIAMLERFTRVLIMAQGRIVKDAPAQEILREMRGGGGSAKPASAPASRPVKPAGLVTTTMSSGKPKDGKAKSKKAKEDGN